MGSATGAPKQAQASKQHEDEYTPWSRFVSANEDVSNREAGNLAGQVQGDVTKAQNELSGAQQSNSNTAAGNYNSKPQLIGGPSIPDVKNPSAPSSSAPSQAKAGPATSTAPLGTTAAVPTDRAPVAQHQKRPTGTALVGENPWSSLQQPSDRTPVAQNQSTQGNAPAPPPQPPRPGAPIDGSNPWANPSEANPSQAPAQLNTNPLVAGLPPPVANVTQAPAAPATQAVPGGPAAHPAAGVSAVPRAMAALQAGDPRAQGLLGYQRSQALKPGATAPKDLESQMGEQAWQSLLNDTQKAQQEANALGSETGVQALLQQKQSSPLQNTKFDAALINGQGAPQFQKLAKQYGGDTLRNNLINAEQASQDRWAQLQGDQATAKSFQDARNRPVQGATTPDATPQDSTDPNAKPDGYYEPGDGFGAANHAMDDVRGDNGTGWNNIGVSMGYFNFGDGQYDTERGAQVTGKEWLDHLPDLLKLGGDPSNPTTFGGQLAQAMSGAATELGLSPDDLKGELSKMVGNELGDFWAFGVIPPWMNVNGGFGKGVMGGWKSPFIQRALSYGKDGGMWNAVLNFWKQGASTVAAGIPVVGGAASSGIKAVPVNTKENKYGS